MKKLFAMALLTALTGINAQPGIEYIGIKGGLIENPVEDNFSGKDNFFYPQLEIGGHFHRNLEWAFYGGYWDDGVEESSNNADLITYSYNSILIGTQLLLKSNPLFGKDFPVKLGLLAGFSVHFINADYVGGFDLLGNAGSDFSDDYSYFDLGGSLKFSVIEKLDIVLELKNYLSMGIKEANPLEKNILVYTAGIDYRI